MPSNAKQKIKQLNEQQSYDFKDDMQNDMVKTVENARKGLKEFAEKVFFVEPSQAL